MDIIQPAREPSAATNSATSQSRAFFSVDFFFASFSPSSDGLLYCCFSSASSALRFDSGLSPCSASSFQVSVSSSSSCCRSFVACADFGTCFVLQATPTFTSFSGTFARVSILTSSQPKFTFNLRSINKHLKTRKSLYFSLVKHALARSAASAITSELDWL